LKKIERRIEGWDEKDMGGKSAMKAEKKKKKLEKKKSKREKRRKTLVIFRRRPWLKL